MTKEELEQLAAEERRKYYREWRAKNKDKVKKYNEQRWIRKAEKLAAEREG
jgi:hypothetical protein